MSPFCNPVRTTQLLMLCLIGQVGCGGSVISNPYGTPRAPPVQSVALYDESSVLDFKLTIAAAEWAAFQQIHSNPPPPSLRDTYTKVYVHCDFEALGVKFLDAACRPKGNPSGWSSELKPQFVIKFEHWNTKGRFLGLRGLNLEANPAALAPVRDRLGMWLMREFGIKAPRANHVRVFKNGSELGLYMNIEEIDKSFLDWQFASPNGNLYSQGAKLQTNKQQLPPVTADRLTTMDSLVGNEPLQGDHSTFFTEIDKVLDIHALLAMTAAETVLPTGDNWSNGGTNYDLYDDPSAAKLIILPWDLDTIMDPVYGPATADPYTFSGAAELQLEPNKMLQLLYQKPEWKREFEDDLVKVRDTVYARLPAYVGTMCAQIRAPFVEDLNHMATAAEFDLDCAYLQKHVADRTAFLRQTLGR